MELPICHIIHFEFGNLANALTGDTDNMFRAFHTIAFAGGYLKEMIGKTSTHNL